MSLKQRGGNTAKQDSQIDGHTQTDHTCADSLAALILNGGEYTVCPRMLDQGLVFCLVA